MLLSLFFLLAGTALCKISEGDPASPDKRFRVGPGSAEDRLAILDSAGSPVLPLDAQDSARGVGWSAQQDYFGSLKWLNNMAFAYDSTLWITPCKRRPVERASVQETKSGKLSR